MHVVWNELIAFYAIENTSQHVSTDFRKFDIVLLAVRRENETDDDPRSDTWESRVRGDHTGEKSENKIGRALHLIYEIDFFLFFRERENDE